MLPTPLMPWTVAGGVPPSNVIGAVSASSWMANFTNQVAPAPYDDRGWSESTCRQPLAEPSVDDVSAAVEPPLIDALAPGVKFAKVPALLATLLPGVSPSSTTAKTWVGSSSTQM